MGSRRRFRKEEVLESRNAWAMGTPISEIAEKLGAPLDIVGPMVRGETYSGAVKLQETIEVRLDPRDKRGLGAIALLRGRSEEDTAAALLSKAIIETLTGDAQRFASEAGKNGSNTQARKQDEEKGHAVEASPPLEQEPDRLRGAAPESQPGDDQQAGRPGEAAGPS